MQNTDTILMVRPAHFGRNSQTLNSNAFQQKTSDTSHEIHQKALEEFDSFVYKLRENNINVIQIMDKPEPHTPDAIFPNNWITFHQNGTVIFYPMEAQNRRWERRRSILQLIEDEFIINNEFDLSHYEESGKFLEGTGSMILDRENKIAYACYSSRTAQEVLDDFHQKMGYEIVLFDAVDSQGKAIYHTNVMMSVAKEYVMIGMDCLLQKPDKEKVQQIIEKTDKEIIELSQDQIQQFAGNTLEILNQLGERILVMSERAYHSLTQEQIQKIEKSAKIVHSPLYTIEDNGGGSARCMIAEIFLPKKHLL